LVGKSFELPLHLEACRATTVNIVGVRLKALCNNFNK